MHDDDHALARELAEEAGRRLLGLRARGGEPEVLRKAGDRLSHEFLVAALADRRPGNVVLSEEGADDSARLAARPGLDRRPARRHQGVRRTGPHRLGRSRGPVGKERGQRGWRSGRGRGRAPGARQRCCPRSTRRAPGGGQGNGPLRIVVSRTRAPRFVQNISDLIGAELLPLGSAGAKVAAVVSGEADAYVHGGGFYEWDTAAPVAVARAAGFHASRIDGSALAYNQADLKIPDILVCRPAVAGLLLPAIREVTHAS